MKFILTENAWEMLSTLGYDGVIGLFYKNTIGGILAYILLFVVIVLTVIGLFTALKWLFRSNGTKSYKNHSWK